MRRGKIIKKIEQETKEHPPVNPPRMVGVLDASATLAMDFE